MYITMIQFSKHKDSGLPAFGATAFCTLSKLIQVIYMCPFYNLETVLVIFLKPSKSVKVHNISTHFIFYGVMARTVAGHAAVLAMHLFLFVF